MSSIILDERAFAEYAIENLALGRKPVETLGRLAKYYHDEGYRRSEIVGLLESFMLKCDPSINIVKWSKAIEYQAKSAEKYKLIDISGINITEREVEIISGITGVLLQRLMFTLLCLAKYGNALSSTNNGWVNRRDREVFSLANIQVVRKRQALMINDLWSSGYIGYSRVIDNININVKIIDDNSSDCIIVTDFRNIGNQWMKLVDSNYIECQNCGIIIKKSANAQKYCRECAAEINRQKANSSKKTA